MRANWRVQTWLVAVAGGLLVAGSNAAYAQTEDDVEQKAGIEGELGALDMMVYFEFDSAALDAQAKQQLDEVATWAKQTSEGKVVIAGHTDKIGSQAYNFELGGERALAAKKYLVAKGIDANRITVISFGESVPASSENERNRRVVFLAQREGAPVASGPAEVEAEADIDADKDVDVDVNVNEPQPYVPPAPAPIVAEEPLPPIEDDTSHLITPAGMSITIGGGVMDFIDGDTRDFTGVAGTWEARFAYGTRTPVGVEAAYVGSAQEVDALGLDTSAALLGSAAEGLLRLNIPVVEYVHPYALAGLGFTRFDIVNEDFNDSSLDDNETALHVPLGVGVGFTYEGFLFDVRGMYRPMFQDDLVNIPEELDEDEDINAAGLDSWAATASMGVEF
jgi:outer membrane protein OmpA-like peptidoglycan-associated protein